MAASMAASMSASESGQYFEEETLRQRKTQRNTQDELNYDEERECEILRNEIERIRKIRENMTPRVPKGAKGAKGVERIDDDGYGYNNSRINACDVTGEEFKIVCEELWVDFKKWKEQHENLTNTSSMFRRAVVRMRFAILFVLVFAVLFRWYVGAGKDACSYGVGYGVFSLVCEVLRYFGEIVVIVFMSFIGACAGLSPFVIGACIFEYDEAFPDPEEEADAGADAGEVGRVGHLKKE
jgi:hypothetical protein